MKQRLYTKNDKNDDIVRTARAAADIVSGRARHNVRPTENGMVFKLP